MRCFVDDLLKYILQPLYFEEIFTELRLYS